MTRKSDTLIPKQPLARIIKNIDNIRVSSSALTELALYLEIAGTKIASLATEYAKHAGRRTILDRDIELALINWNKK